MSLEGRSVLVTGHTGFKGSWLSLSLAELGAHVHGYALEPPSDPNLFDTARLRDVVVSDTRADLADREALRRALDRIGPEVVFHLAARSLVSDGYREPRETFATNVLGTANLLDAIRGTPAVRAVVLVATDKVYQNSETGEPFRERDPLGGRDPYSASKAAAELVGDSYRASFFGGREHRALIASARAGNVIGGGDWAGDRLIPDCMRAFTAGRPIRLRHPDAVRPWQHVLGPLGGYVSLAERLLAPDGAVAARAWNFGPDAEDDATVGDVAGRLAALWGPDAAVERGPDPAWHEAGVLRLDSSEARERLGWRPRWGLDEALARTVEWYRAWRAGGDVQRLCREQISAYRARVAA